MDFLFVQFHSTIKQLKGDNIMKRFFFYAFALFILISIIYSIAYDYMTGAKIHYDFYGAFFVCWLIFFGILKRVLRV